MRPPDAPSRALVEPTFSRHDERGTFTEIVGGGPWHAVITGSMRAGAVLGDHYHKKTRLFLFLTEGRARIDQIAVDSGKRWSCELPPATGLYLEANHAHAIHFLEPSRFILLKSLPYREDDPDTYAYPVPCAD